MTSLPSITNPDTTASSRFRRKAAKFAALAAATTLASGLALAGAIGVSSAVGPNLPFTVNVTQRPTNALVPIDNAGRGSRDVQLSTYYGAPGGSVWFGVQDTTTHVWYGGWTNSTSAGYTTQTIAGIPASSCGHPFRADASDWGEPGAPAATTQYFVDDCKPEISISSTGVVTGNGFTPGGSVYVSGSDGFGDHLTATVTASTYTLNLYPRAPTPQGQIGFATSLHSAPSPQCRDEIVQAYDYGSQTWATAATQVCPPIQ